MPHYAIEVIYRHEQGIIEDKNFFSSFYRFSLAFVQLFTGVVVSNSRLNDATIGKDTNTFLSNR
ncbi:hypothetical protein B7486_31325 [cyanobacterium TDX16]|nr:hypothetical protein B7486_31325 [cyanobacterium TDX16]